MSDSSFMRVLYFHQHFSTPSGAAGTRSYEFARHLVQAGHSVTMVCGSFGIAQTGLSGPYAHAMRRGLVDGIDVIELQLPYSNSQSLLERTRVFLSFALRSIGIALREPCDVVFATTTPLTAGLPGIAARWLRGRRFVFEVRDLWPELPKAMGIVKNPLVLRMLDWLEWLSYHSARHVIGLAPGICDGIRRRGIAADRVTMIPNACDLELFGAHVPPWRPAELEGKILAVFTGTLGQANGLDVLLQATRVLHERGRSDIAVAIFGEGKLKPTLQDTARQYKLTNLHFYDAVPKTRIAQLLQSADIGLQILADVPAFYYGTSPNKFFDYLASGLPVVCNYPGWVAELIAAHDTGRLAPPRNPEALADAIVACADDAAARQRMRRNARQLAESQFNRKILAGQFEACLQQATV